MVSVRKADSARTIIIVLVIGALGFATALAINDFGQALVKRYFPIQDELWGQLVYLIFIIVLLVITAYLVHKYFPATEELL